MATHSSGEGNGTPLQYSCLENPMDGGAWWAAVHGFANSQTQLSDFTFMHWRRKWQPTPVFLPGESQGWRSLVGHHLWGHTESDITEATYQPTPVFWPGKFHGLDSPWGRKESDMTEQPSLDYSHLWNKNIYTGSWPSSKVCYEVKWNDGL